MKKAVWILLLICNLFAYDMVNSSFVDFVRFVANSTQKNFILDEDIETNFQIIFPSFYNPKDSFEVLKNTLKKHDMHLEKVGTTYYIKKNNESVSFYSYHLKFIYPDKIIKIIKKYYPNLHISKSKKTIIYFSKYKEHLKIRKLIDLLDKPNKSKVIKITLISYNNDKLKSYGLNIDTSVVNNSKSIGYKTFLNYLLSSSQFYINLDNFNLSIYLDNLKTHQIIRSRFSPTLTLFDGQNATFSISQKIPFLNGTATVNGTNDVQRDMYSYNDVGTFIKIDNISITDTEVYFHINLTYELILDKSITPTTSKRFIDSFLKLKDGQSVIISGIKSNEISKVHKEIPILSSIPLLGTFFEWDSNEDKNYTFAIIVSLMQERNASVKEGVPPL